MNASTKIALVHTTPRASRLGLALILALSAPLAACGGADTAAPEEDGKATEAVVVNQEFSQGPIELTGLADVAGLGNLSLTVNDYNQATFLLSTQLTQAVYGDPNPADSAITFSTPDVWFDMPDPFPKGLAHIESFNMTGVTATLGDGEIDLDSTGTGVVEVSLPWPLPTFDVNLNAVTVHVALVPDATGTTLSLLHLNINVQDNVSNCLLGACDSLVDGLLPNLGDMLQSAAQPPLESALAEPVVAKWLATALDTWSTDLAPTEGVGTAWQFVPGSFALTSAPTIDWTATRVLPPSVPTGCVAWETCGPGVGVYCNSQAETFQLLRAGVSAPVATAVGQLSLPATYLYDTSLPAGATSESYTVCTTNAAGTACTPSPLTVSIVPMTCTSSSGGGSVGGSPPPISHKPVLQ